MRRTTARFALWTGVCLASLGCGTTRLDTVWADSEATASDLAFQHVVAIAALREEALQRAVEDALASAAIDTEVTPGYRLVSRADRADVDRLRTVLEGHGIDGAIVVRLVDIREEEVFVPRTGGSYGGYYDHWRRAGVRVYESGYYRTDTEVTVETRLYDVHDGRLLWAATSNTINPRDVDEVIEGIVESAGHDLRERGLIP